MTTKSSLDDVKLDFEEMPIKKPKTSTVRVGINPDAFKPKPKKIKRPNFIKSYFKYIVEVILK
jgi:hypothetical protein